MAQSAIGDILKAFTFEADDTVIRATYNPAKMKKTINLTNEADYYNSIDYTTAPETVKDFKQSITLDYSTSFNKKPDLLPKDEFDPEAFLRHFIPEVIKETMQMLGMA